MGGAGCIEEQLVGGAGCIAEQLVGGVGCIEGAAGGWGWLHRGSSRWVGLAA